MKRKRSYQKLMAWKAFSKYIRLRDANKQGIVSCISCGVRKDWSEMQAGHAVAGRGNAVLFDPDLVAGQCAQCNNNSGEQWKFAQGLKKRHGYTDAEIDELFNRKHKVVKYSQSDLWEIEQTYTDMAVGESIKKGFQL